MEQPNVIRQSNGDYRVLSSGGEKFYTVEMFGEHAASCTCRHFRLGHKTCKHMEAAELAEKAYQTTGQGGTTSTAIPERGTDAARWLPVAQVKISQSLFTFSVETFSYEQALQAKRAGISEICFRGKEFPHSGKKLALPILESNI